MGVYIRFRSPAGDPPSGGRSGHVPAGLDTLRRPSRVLDRVITGSNPGS